MKRLVLLLVVAISACSPKKDKDPPLAPTEIGDTTIVSTGDNSRNSLDYIGRYTGKIGRTPTALELSEDFSYVLTSAGNTIQEQKGTYKWNPDGNGIILKDKGGVERYFYVGEGYVALADRTGKRPQSPNTVENVLTKQSESEAAKSDGTPIDRLPQKITGIHWKLSEINGRTLKQPADRDYFIRFRDDGGFGAFAGCNRMGGKYELNGSKVRMFQIISTMMACPEMKIEDEFKKALETSDNFVANEKVLQFRKGGANLLKFEAFAISKP